MARRLSTTVVMRSVSLTRSSLALRMIVRPWANAAATAITGISSIRLGTSSRKIVVPVRGAPWISMLPIGSPSDWWTISVMCAPIRLRTLRIAVRVGLRPTSLISKREPGRAAAATSQKAALEMSPGTVKSQACGVWPPSSEIALPSWRVWMPNEASMRSVWSRVSAGWMTVVVPSAKSPASSTALFTWALATGMS